jgi:hypothetical protein
MLHLRTLSDDLRADLEAVATVNGENEERTGPQKNSEQQFATSLLGPSARRGTALDPKARRNTMFDQKLALPVDTSPTYL